MDKKNMEIDMNKGNKKEKNIEEKGTEEKNKENSHMEERFKKTKIIGMCRYGR